MNVVVHKNHMCGRSFIFIICYKNCTLEGKIVANADFIDVCNVHKIFV